ncbi:MAG: sigma-54-dependent Fis family transcriptional regulator [Bacillota bacterium]
MPTAWEELRESIDEVRRQWSAFRLGAQPEPRLRLPIVRSWRRCRDLGLPDREPGGSFRRAGREAHRELITAAAPVLSDLKGALRQTSQVLVLCDPQARALLVEGDPTARRSAERINLVPGSDWSEGVSGTNAMGTALAESHHVIVFATEHYLEDLHPWACVAAPIIHPTTGRAVGVLDLSGRHMVINGHTELAILGAVQAIQSRLAAREAELHRVLLSSLADRMASLRRGGLGVIDRNGLLLRFAGMPLPGRDSWYPSVQRLLRENQPFEETLPEARLTFRPVHWEGEVIGALVEAARPAQAPEVREESPLPGLVGHDPHWLAAATRAMRAAQTEATVLITGETGTGKEVVARAIHRAGARSAGPFVALNCGALPPHLVASQLFGYTGGAFTGANPRGQAGLFEMAQHGTLFLDEVSELSPEAQVALLRVLQEREVVRIGGQHPIKVDIRVLAASNKDLTDLVARGLFREDLYFRLNVFPLLLPPLRDRPQDIIPLVAHAYRRLGVEPQPLPPTSWQRLLQYRWPGNVRELLNLVEQAVALGEDPADLLPLPPLPSTPIAAEAEPEEAERIRRALDGCDGNAAAAARALGMGRSTLYRKLELYGIRLKRQVE